MNWLAHLFLSEPDVEIRLGNLLADVVKGSDRQNLNQQIQRGIKCHQIIDQFTDNHSIVQRSKQRLYPEYRRFSGVIVDVFYDHFLAKNWSIYTNIPLDEFTSEIYTSFQNYQGQIPYIVRQLITRVANEDWLGSYRQIVGVENTLIRISRRLTRRINKHFMLHLSVRELANQYNEFEKDFLEFFPELILYIKNYNNY